MRTFTRVVFGANAVYQGGVGLLCLFAPALTIELYGGGEADLQMLYLRAILRGLGATLLLTAVISAMIARDPDARPVLLVLLGVTAVFTLLAWSLAVLAREVSLDQVALDITVQAVVLATVALYYPQSRAAILAAAGLPGRVEGAGIES